MGKTKKTNIIGSAIAVIIILAVVGAGAYFTVIRLLKTGDQPPAVENSEQAGAGAGERAGAAANSVPAKSGAKPEAIAEIPGYQYTETYISADYGFAFKHPPSFTVTEMPAENGLVILVENIKEQIGVQILITPFDGQDQDLTKADIAAEIPDLKISDEQEVLIGSGRKGLAFMSDNPAFGGQSREVWFVYGGRLYQISTYAELDRFLKGLFGTWEFR